MTGKGFYVATSYRLAELIEQEFSTKTAPFRRGVNFSFVKVVPSFQVLTLWLSINPTYSRKLMGMAKELTQAACLPKGQFIRVDWGGEGVLELQIPKPAEICTAPKMEALPRQDGVKMAVGFDTRNLPAIADFSNPISAHALVAGTSGCGKTNLGRLMAYSLAMQNQPSEVKFLLVDTADAGLAWVGFEDLPHLVHGVVSDEKTARAGLDWLTGEMDGRAAERRVTPRIFCFIDEIQELARDNKFVDPLERLARRGRKWGINLVVTTQRPVADSLPTTVKSLLPLRFCGKVTGASEAAWATDLPQSGAEALVGPGDMLLVQPSGAIQRMATPLLADADLAQLPPPSGQGRVTFPEPQAEAPDETGNGSDPDFTSHEYMLSLIAARHDKGRPFLKRMLEGETGHKPGSKRASRLLQWGREAHQILARYRYQLALTPDP